ncbi:MAG TPA: hypothetical protein VF260_01510, partial [Bacilli bacterium]
ASVRPEPGSNSPIKRADNSSSFSLRLLACLVHSLFSFQGASGLLLAFSPSLLREGDFYNISHRACENQGEIFAARPSGHGVSRNRQAVLFALFAAARTNLPRRMTQVKTNVWIFA